jgi:hypothetical protein
MELYKHILNFINTTYEDIDETMLNNYFNLIIDKNIQINELVKEKIDNIQKLSNIISQVLELKNISNRKNSKRILNIILVNDSKKRKLFEDFTMLFYFESYLINQYGKLVSMKSRHNYLSIDLEFNGKNVALMQLHFETPTMNFIFIVDPNEFSEEYKELFCQNLLENRFVIKIMHGSESLDLPYIYRVLLNNNSNKIHKFTNSLFDTRFACEYVKFYNNDNNPKCTLYTALLDYDVIDKQQYQSFLDLYNEMGPIQDIAWSVHNLGKAQLKYAYFDVVYLRYLYSNIVKKSSVTTTIYKGLQILPEIFRLVCLERAGVTNIIDIAKNESDKMNNYIVYTKTESNKMIDIYNKIIENLIIDDSNISVFIKITFLKKSCISLFKKVIYTQISREYQIYIKKGTKFTEQLSMDVIYDKLKSFKLNRLIKFLRHIDTKVLASGYPLAVST